MTTTTKIKLTALLFSFSAFALCVQAGAAPKAAPKSPPHWAAPAKAKASPTKVRLAQVRRDAAGIKPGTPRSLVIRLFPDEDGGLGLMSVTRYYAGNGVMVDVPYDDHGGEGKAGNRVNGPLRVYLSPPHFN